MSIFKKKHVLQLVLAVLVSLFMFSSVDVYAATVGQQLLQPEAEWKRYDDTNVNILYTGLWVSSSNTDYYGGTLKASATPGDTVKFKFLGSKFRLISRIYSQHDSNVSITIDNVPYTFSLYNSAPNNQILVFELLTLDYSIHEVEMKVVNNGKYVVIDAIDIDENGYLLDYNQPTNLQAIAGNSQVTLTWDAVEGATGYNVKRAAIAGGPYATVASNVYGTSYIDNNVTPGTTYYYVVSAITSSGESSNSNEASATPIASGKALLTITMTNGMEKEYDLSMVEVESFIDWYNNKANGVGSATYVINKTCNKGPFVSRKDYLIFDKIFFFEVNEYIE